MLKKISRLGTSEVIAFLALLVIAVGFWTKALTANSAAPLILSSFLSTFCGATYAFRLNVNKELNKKREDQCAALQLALFTMARQYNGLVNLWDSVKDWEKRGDRAINMPAIQQPYYEALTQNFEHLAFLLESATPVLLLELTLEQERFTQTIALASARAKFHVEEVQPEIAKTNLNHQVMTIAEVEGSIGERIFGTIENQTNELFDHLSFSMRSFPVTAKKLYDLAKAEYPDKKFVTVQFLTTDELAKRRSPAKSPTATTKADL